MRWSCQLQGHGNRAFAISQNTMFNTISGVWIASRLLGCSQFLHDLTLTVAGNGADRNLCSAPRASLLIRRKSREPLLPQTAILAFCLADSKSFASRRDIALLGSSISEEVQLLVEPALRRTYVHQESSTNDRPTPVHLVPSFESGRLHPVFRYWKPCHSWHMPKYNSLIKATVW